MAISRSLRTTLAGTAAALAIGVLSAPAAHANGADNHQSPDACNAQTESRFNFTLWYNSSYSGSHRNFGSGVNNFADEPYGGDDPHTNPEPLSFCPDQGNGSGQGVKNNAASAQNRDTRYNAVIFFRSWCQGARDTLTPMSSWFQLKETYNNNASFDWRS
ncbi:hypothetical protein P3T27_007826 [Kitasatospora sp. MAA19]|uniref:hypothetical protein n=1 Tax=Kitasatospora sp. MAA19 TaxID=3035090 RepID=UPI00247605DD|nr:hypothetical protein [Kitasatospora sp. MAA19]MDH6711074.1 hypothetical protein [Kitasatospora sp. MAA19]